MNKKKSKIILLIVLFIIVLLSILACLYFFKWRQAGVSSDGDNTPEPYLELTFKEYPSRIDTICQRVEFVLDAKNTGTKSLKYSDLDTNAFAFSLIRKESMSIVTHTDDDLSGNHDLFVDDFGTIEVGQTKELHFYTQRVYSGEYDFGYDNAFNSIQYYGNGSAQFYIEFQRINGGNSYTILSNLPLVSIDIEAFEYSSDGLWSNKICN